MDLGSHVPLPTYTVLGSHVPQPLAVVKPMSPEEVEKAQAAAQERVQQQVDAQNNLATQVAEQSEKAACAQITAKRDAKLLALEQVFVEEKMKLDQERVQTMAGIEQEALARQAEAVQARAVPGAPVVLSPETIADQKTQKLELARARCDAALAQLTARHEGLREQVALKAERKLALATSRIAAERSDRVAGLDQQLDQERVARLPLADRQAALAERVSQAAERALERVTQQVETEKSVAVQAADLSEKTVCAQIVATRDTKLLALEQSYVEEKQKLEQDLARQVAGIELEAAQVAGAAVLGSETIAEQKTQKLELAQAQCDAALAQLTAQHEGRREQVALKAERKLALATSQIAAERSDRVAGLDQRLDQERVARLPLADRQAALAERVSQAAERALERVTQQVETEK